MVASSSWVQASESVQFDTFNTWLDRRGRRIRVTLLREKFRSGVQYCLLSNELKVRNSQYISDPPTPLPLSQIVSHNRFMFAFVLGNVLTTEAC